MRKRLGACPSGLRPSGFSKCEISGWGASLFGPAASRLPFGEVLPPRVPDQPRGILAHSGRPLRGPCRLGRRDRARRRARARTGLAACGVSCPRGCCAASLALGAVAGLSLLRGCRCRCPGNLSSRTKKRASALPRGWTGTQKNRVASVRGSAGLHDLPGPLAFGFFWGVTSVRGSGRCKILENGSTKILKIGCLFYR